MTSAPTTASATPPPTTTAPVPPTASDPPTTTAAPSTTTEPAGDLAGRTIVIDPGHNGANGAHPSEINRPVDAGGFTKACNTTGTAEPGLTESALNFDIATRVRDLLLARGAEVVLTRPDDDGWGPCIDERGRSAAANGADVLLSIHADGAAPGAHGFHVISSPASGPGSAELAATLRDALVDAGRTPATYVGDDGLVVRSDLGTLNWATSAAAMVECGNMHDERDLAVFRDPVGRQGLAEALADGVARSLGA